jgi:hypothetical protein
VNTCRAGSMTSARPMWTLITATSQGRAYGGGGEWGGTPAPRAHGVSLHCVDTKHGQGWTLVRAAHPPPSIGTRGRPDWPRCTSNMGEGGGGRHTPARRPGNSCTLQGGGLNSWAERPAPTGHGTFKGRRMVDVGTGVGYCTHPTSRRRARTMLDCAGVREATSCRP